MVITSQCSCILWHLKDTCWWCGDNLLQSWNDMLDMFSLIVMLKQCTIAHLSMNLGTLMYFHTCWQWSPVLLWILSQLLPSPWSEHFIMSIMHEKVCGKGTYGCLKCVHHEGYAHGDVRCSNIIFSKSVVFLINFELVRHLPDVYPHRMSVETTLHCRKQLVGT